MGFPERLQEIIEERHTTNYKISKKIKISASTISNYLKGKTQPDAAKLDVLSQSLGVSAIWLKTGQEPKYITATLDIAYTKSQQRQDTPNQLVEIIRKQTDIIQEKDHHISWLMKEIDKLNETRK